MRIVREKREANVSGVFLLTAGAKGESSYLRWMEEPRPTFGPAPL